MSYVDEETLVAKDLLVLAKDRIRERRVELDNVLLLVIFGAARSGLD